MMMARHPPSIRQPVTRERSASRPAVPIPLAVLLGFVAATWLLLAWPAAAGGSTIEGEGPVLPPGSEPGSATLEGVVVDEVGRPFLGAIVRLHLATDEGRPGVYLRPAYTGVDGTYRLDDLAAACYAVIVEAPAGTEFGSGAATDEQVRCLDGGQADDSLRSVARRPSAGPSSADAGTSGRTGTAADAASGALDPAGTDPVPAVRAAAPARTLTLLHVGQHRGRVEPLQLELQLGDVAVEAEVGGWARIVTALDRARPADAPESVLAVHTGGVLGGSALARVFGGAAGADLLNHACLDYLAPGPADRARSDELDVFHHFLSDGRCDTTMLGSIEPPVALHPIGDETVALVAADGGADGGPAGDGDLAGVVAATGDRIERLLDDGITTIVVVSGLGLDADRELAAALPAVDAVIGGGGSSLLGDLAPLGLAPDGPYPERLTNADGDPVCLGHTGTGGRSVGRLELGLDERGRVVRCGGRLQFLLGAQAVAADGTGPLPDDDRAAVAREIATHPELSTVEPDAGVTAALARWTAALDLRLDDPVATVTDELCHTSVPSRTVGLLCGPGDHVVDITGPRPDVQQVVADAFRWWGGSDRSAGSGPIVSVIDSATTADAVGPGPLTLLEAYRLLGHQPHLVVVELTGAELAAALEEAVAAGLDADPTTQSAYPHTSGVRSSPDLAEPEGRRVGPIEVLTGDDRWEPIDPTGGYVVITTDLLVGPASPHATIRAAVEAGRGTTTNVGGAEVLVDYVDRVLDGVIEPPNWPAASSPADAQDDGS